MLLMLLLSDLGRGVAGRGVAKPELPSRGLPMLLMLLLSDLADALQQTSV